MSELIKTLINYIVEILKRFYYCNAWFVLPFSWDKALFSPVSKQHIFFNCHLAVNSVSRFLMCFPFALCVCLISCRKIKRSHSFSQIWCVPYANSKQDKCVKIFKTELQQLTYFQQRKNSIELKLHSKVFLLIRIFILFREKKV